MNHAALIRSAERRLRKQLQRPAPPAPATPATTLETRAAEGLHGDAQSRVDAWFARQDMRPLPFQREAWTRYRAGESGLLHASTGTGKTLAAWLGPVMDAIDANSAHAGLRVLWITPMRALAADTLRALAAPLGELGLSWRVGLRTGDTVPADRARQDRKPLHAMVTTPESLSLLLSRGAQAKTFGALEAVIVDEWHELLGSKRGVQVELALARLKRLAPGLRIWGLSATLGNIDEARRVLVGGDSGCVVAGVEDKTLVVDSLLPEDIRKYPWAGHLGTRAVEGVVAEIEKSGTTLVFTNVRSQAEQWYRALLDVRPEWAGSIGLHHASLDVSQRRWVEQGLREGSLKAVVCTSSLDLGVDFSPVDRVMQIGSPKGVARLLQRAGRSGHRPGVASRVTCVPAHALELIEAAAVREALADGVIQARRPCSAPLDVLVQHVVTIAAGEGFRADELLAEVRSAHAFRSLTDEDWNWVIGFAAGGGVLSAYPEYHRIDLGEDSVYRVNDPKIARRHRAQIGTIVSDASVNVQFVRGGALGTVEESFAARLRHGERFAIAGRTVEFVRMREMTAFVRLARDQKGVVPRWMGGRLSLSDELSRYIQAELERAASGSARSPEALTLMPLIDLQRRHSHVPRTDELLAEIHVTREGWHLCVFPFAGRHVNGALAAMTAWRLARLAPLTFSMAFTDYGFELLSATPFDMHAELLSRVLSPVDAVKDVIESVNAAELARRHFREIARVAGLVFQGYPGESRSAKHLQASSGLVFDVYERHDPGNPLLAQARREVIERELDLPRFEATVETLATRRIVLVQPKRMTPLALPLVADQMRNRVSSEKLADRVMRMQLVMQKPEGKLRAAA